jgi:signal transduction histidine kinase
MPNLWIVHREVAARRTLARLAGPRVQVVVGSPGDRDFESAPEPDVILLGPSGDFEAELEFAHRYSQRRPGASWILLPEAGAGDDVRQLFDALSAEIRPPPPPPPPPRRRPRPAPDGRRRHDSLSERRVRDALADRFRRWFSDLELPDLLRAVDPHLATVPVLIRGEPGTGRTVIAQYIHVFGGSTGGIFVHLPCRGMDGAAAAMLDLIRSATHGGDALTICLEDVDTLPPLVQRQLRIWIESGLPPGTVCAERVRWIATAAEEDSWSGETPLDPTLEDALAGIAIRIPPLRERMQALDAMVASAAASWCHQHGQRMRSFTPEALATLREVLWLGNVREVEATVARTLASHAEDPIRESDLVLDGSGPGVEGVAEAGARSWPHEPEIDELTTLAPGGRPLDERPRPTTEPEAAPAPSEAEARPARPAASAAEARSASAAEARSASASALRAAPAATRETSPTSARGAAPVAAREATPTREAASDSESAHDGSAERLRELVGSIAHEIRNPLVAVRTFAQLLPERFDDPDFRRKAADIVGADVRRIENVVARLTRLAELASPEPKAVDVASLIETALEAQRPTIQRRRLVVLTELDRRAPHALGDAEQLRFAFESLLDKALELVPDRGDLYFASKHHADGLDGAPALRILVRFRSPGDVSGTSVVPGVSLGESSLEMTVARSIVRAHGGRMTVSPGDARETVVVIDLPAPT